MFKRLSNSRRVIVLSFFVALVLIETPVYMYGLSRNEGKKAVITATPIPEREVAGVSTATESPAPTQATSRNKVFTTPSPTTPAVKTNTQSNTTSASSNTSSSSNNSSSQPSTTPTAPPAPNNSPTPSPAPQDDGTPFQADWVLDGSNATITANKPLSECQQYSKKGGLEVQGSGSINGSVCAISFSNSDGWSYGARVQSIFGQSKTFGVWPNN